MLRFVKLYKTRAEYPQRMIILKLSQLMHLDAFEQAVEPTDACELPQDCILSPHEDAVYNRLDTFRALYTPATRGQGKEPAAEKQQPTQLARSLESEQKRAARIIETCHKMDCLWQQCHGYGLACLKIGWNLEAQQFEMAELRTVACMMKREGYRVSVMEKGKPYPFIVVNKE